MEILFRSDFVCSSNFTLTSFCVHLFLIGDQKILHKYIIYKIRPSWLSLPVEFLYQTDIKIGSKYVKIWKINVPTIDENGSDMQKENSLDSEGLKDGKSF